MRDDPAYVILLGTIIGLLAIIYAIAIVVKNRKRHHERESLESVIQAREKGDDPAPTPPPVVVEAPRVSPPVVAAVPQSGPLPVVKPPLPKPRPKALIAWVPPVTDGPPRFNQYITWPNTKVATPVAERAPAEKDYVWD